MEAWALPASFCLSPLFFHLKLNPRHIQLLSGVPLAFIRVSTVFSLPGSVSLPFPLPGRAFPHRTTKGTDTLPSEPPGKSLLCTNIHTKFLQPISPQAKFHFTPSQASSGQSSPHPAALLSHLHLPPHPPTTCPAPSLPPPLKGP